MAEKKIESSDAFPSTLFKRKGLESIKELKEEIKAYRIKLKNVKKDAPDLFKEWVKGHNTGLKVALIQIDSFKEGVRERIGLFSHEKTSEKTTAKFLRNVFLDIRLEELRKVLGEEK